MKVILPFELSPIIRTYLNHAYPFGIVEGHFGKNLFQSECVIYMSIACIARRIETIFIYIPRTGGLKNVASSDKSHMCARIKQRRAYRKRSKKLAADCQRGNMYTLRQMRDIYPRSVRGDTMILIMSACCTVSMTAPASICQQGIKTGDMFRIRFPMANMRQPFSMCKKAT